MVHTIAGQKISESAVRTATLISVFVLVPPWDTIICIILEFYFVLTMCLLARVVMWIAVSFSVINKWKDTKRALGATVAAFLLLVPIEMIHFMAMDDYILFGTFAFARLITCFVLLIVAGSVKKI